MVEAYAVTDAGQQWQKTTIDLGELSPEQVDISVDYCGICHSDLSMKENHWGLTQYPFVGGHEVVGRVSAVGDSVNHLRVGQLVGLGWQSQYCNSCGFCDTGDKNLCGSAEGTIIGRHGGFASTVRAQQDAVVVLPEGMDPKLAGPLFCGGITVFNPLVQFDIKPTDRVAVIGIGGLGHLAIQFLHAWGCEVTAFTSTDSKADDARKMGAHHVINSSSPEALAAAAGRFDLIISTVNVKLDWNAYLNTLKAKGRLHFVGATLEPLDLGVFNLILGQRSVSGSPVGSPNTISQMLDFCVQHNINPQVELYKMSQINDAFEYLESGNARYRIVLENDL